MYNCQRELKSSEEGVVILVVMAAIFIFGFVAILVLDVSSMQLTARNTQTVADAAALAGAAYLDGTEDGWKNAKRATVIFFRENVSSISASNASSPGEFGTKSGMFDPIEDVDDFAFTEYEIGDISIEIRRGSYYSNSGCTNEFQSLEVGQEKIFTPTHPNSNPGDDEDTRCPLAECVLEDPAVDQCNCDVFVLANAVEVKVSVTDPPTFFIDLIPGLSNVIPPIARTGVGSKPNYEPPIGPNPEICP